MKKAMLFLLLACSPLLVGEAAGGLEYPTFGTYRMVKATGEDGKALRVPYRQYKMHADDEALILWVEPRDERGAVPFSVRREVYARRDVTQGELQLLTVTDSGYTQRWRNNQGRWITEEWRRTHLAGEDLELVQTLVCKDAGRSVQGLWRAVDHRFLLLTPHHVVDGRGLLSGSVDDYRRSWMLFTGKLWSVAYTDDGRFLYDGTAHSIGPGEGDERGILNLCAYTSLYHGDIMQGETEPVGRLHLRHNGFVGFYPYASSDVGVAGRDGRLYGNLEGEGDTWYAVGVQDTSHLSKDTLHLVTLRAGEPTAVFDGGYVFAGCDTVLVRRQPSDGAPVVGTLVNPHSEMADPLRCVGTEGGWYAVGLSADGQGKRKGYVRKDECFWSPWDGD